MSIEKYPRAMRALHWLMALVIITLIVVGIYMTGLEDSPGKFQIYGLHKAFGVIALLLIAVRIAIRAKSTVPALPSALTRAQQMAAHGAHHLLYLLMVLMPVSGYVMSAAHPKQYGVSLFGLALPNLPPSEFWAGLAHQVHSIGSYVLVVVLIAHIAGAVKHKLSANGEADVLPRMLG